MSCAKNRLALRTRRRPPPPPLFPYTTLFRSGAAMRSRRSSSCPTLSWETLAARSWKILKSVRVCQGGWIAGLKELTNGCMRSEEHTSELQSRGQHVCRLLLEAQKYRYHGASD